MATNAEISQRLTAVEQTLNKHLLECAKNSADVANALGLGKDQVPINIRLDEIEKAPVKAIKWIGGIVAASAATVMAAVILSHIQTQQTVEAAELSAKHADAQASAANAKITQATAPQ